MYYIDTNIWIYAITANAKYGENCNRILEDVWNEKIEAVISTLVLIEIVGVLWRDYKIKDTTNHVDALLSYDMDIAIVTPDIIRTAAEYARDYNIWPYDAIHVAVSTHRKITKMISADKELDKIDLIQRVDPLEYVKLKWG